MLKLGIFGTLVSYWDRLFSPLTRMFLFVLIWPCVLVVFITVYEWYQEEFPSPPDQPPNTNRIQHPIFHPLALHALKNFKQLSAANQNAVIANLKANLIPMEQWLKHLRQADAQILCLGEFHKEATRQFLADEFFAKFKLDVLLLEATPKELARINQRVESGRAYFPLLGADISKILRTIQPKNMRTRICGIEETDKQRQNRRDRAGSRDLSITHNFWNRYQPGMRTIILFGALHCSNHPEWLFQYLHDQATPSVAKQLLNIQVLGEHQDGPLEAFVYFLDEIERVQSTSFVIPDTGTLHPLIYQWFLLLNQQVLAKFRTLVVFRLAPVGVTVTHPPH